MVHFAMLLSWFLDMSSPFLGLFGQAQKAYDTEGRLQGIDLHMSSRVDCANHMYLHAETRLEESHSI